MPLPTTVTTTPSPVIIYWFRHDLRLDDNPAFVQACALARHLSGSLLCVYCHRAALAEQTRWLIPRNSQHRQYFLASGLSDLQHQLASAGSDLLEIEGDPGQILPALAQDSGATHLFCEDIAAPEEQSDVKALQAAGLRVQSVWQSSLLNPEDLPFATDALPDVFSRFRQLTEQHGVLPPAPVVRPEIIPPLPPIWPGLKEKWQMQRGTYSTYATSVSVQDERSSFPYWLPAFSGSTNAAAAHLQQYFKRRLADTYKLTRNALTGRDDSTKLSPWLACGTLSARQMYAALKEYEAAHGANDGTYWIWFELLWRDYFRFLHLKYGSRLYQSHGLVRTDTLPPSTHNQQQFEAWCHARTGEPLVDAGMAELAATGFLSNRMRQIVASYCIHDLGCDWRAGAAWFEAQLIDYDVYSNQGNWLYIAGRGTDPRGGRRFNLQKQMQEYDPDGHYQHCWQPHAVSATTPASSS